MHLVLKKTARPTLFGPITHYVGKRLDNSDYSHGELLFKTGWSGSSVMGQGVRFKRINYTAGAWDFYTLPDALEPMAHACFSLHNGEPYDNGYMLRFGIPIFKESPTKWGCIEIICTALGWSDTWRYGPGGCLSRCKDMYGSKLVENPEILLNNL
mgnify:CR=1 FL=1